MEAKENTRTRIEDINDLEPKLTLSEDELRLVSGGRATFTPDSTCAKLGGTDQDQG